MSSAIYDREGFFTTLKTFNEKFKNLDNIQDSDNIYVLNSTSEIVDFGQKISLSLNKDGNEILNFSMTYYDEEEFKKTVKQPFMWDSDARERFEESQFNTFLVEKNLYQPYQISVKHNGKILKDEDLDGENDEDKIDELLYSIDFIEVVESALYNPSNQTKKKIKP